MENMASDDITPPSIPQPHDFRTLVGLVREDFRTNGGDWRLPGVQALFAYRLGRYRLSLPNTPRRKVLSLLYRLLQRRARNRFGIEMHATANIGRRVRIIHQNGIVIHNFAVIGDDCWIRQGVTIGGGVDWASDDHPTLGRDVRIGVGAVLMGRFSVGDGARIGPNVVQSSDVPAGAMVVAPKARQINRRSRPQENVSRSP